MSLEARVDALEKRNVTLKGALEKTISAVEASLSDDSVLKKGDKNTARLEVRIDALEKKLERLRQALAITIDTLERQVVK